MLSFFEEVDSETGGKQVYIYFNKKTCEVSMTSFEYVNGEFIQSNDYILKLYNIIQNMTPKQIIKYFVSHGYPYYERFGIPQNYIPFHINIKELENV
jgi:hypothetical protein